MNNIEPFDIQFDLPEDAALTRVSKAITTGKIFLAATPGIEYIQSCLIDLLSRGYRGMVIGAESTFGKSNCLRFILNTLSDSIGALVPFLIVEKLPDGSSPEGSLLLAIGEELGLPMTSFTPIVERVNAIAVALYQWAMRSPYQTVVLALDESQSIRAIQLRCLKTIGNKLQARNCDMFLILAGQESLFSLEDVFLKTAPGEVDQLAERFLHNFRLPGFTDHDQLKDFLQSFDQAEYPRGCSVVGRFLPRAVSGGFTVASLYEDMWMEVIAAMPGPLQSKPEIGTGHTVQMLVNYLMDNTKSDAVDFKFIRGTDSLKKALARTRFEKSVLNRGKPKDMQGGDGGV